MGWKNFCHGRHSTKWIGNSKSAAELEPNSSKKTFPLIISFPKSSIISSSISFSQSHSPAGSLLLSPELTSSSSMALETWLIKKVKSALSHRHAASTKPIHPVRPRKTNTTKKNNVVVVGILSFEIAGLMLKLLHLWHSLSDETLPRLHDSVLSLDGVSKLVSTDESFLLGLVRSEMVESLRAAAVSVAQLGLRCDDPILWEFWQALEEFANSGRDLHGWVLCPREMESVAKTMDRYVRATALLQREIHQLAAMESGLRKAVQRSGAVELDVRAINLRQKILWQRDEVKSLRERSLWGRSFNSVTSILVRSVFTALARIKLVFGLPGSLSASAAAHPEGGDEDTSPAEGFFERNLRALRPPAGTLGHAALAHHYAGLIIVIEKMIRSPQLIGLDTREDLYAMLPWSIRSALRGRLRGVRVWAAAADCGLAAEWREAMGQILGWLLPVAHNTVRWQSERSFEQQNLVQRMNRSSSGSNGGVLILQTLYFANRAKAEAAIAELLVGLNYIWRFEREMAAKALLQGFDFGQLHLQQFSV